MKYIDTTGALYEGDMRPGDRAATPEEIAAWQAANAPTPAPISDRQFARGLWGEGIITFEECEAFCATGAIPAAMQALIDQLPDDATGAPTPRKEARIFVRGAKEYRRDHPLVATLGAAFGWSPEQIDARWTAWAAL